MSVHANGEHRPRQAVLVTGASSGIGEAIALDLYRRGFHVFAGVRSESAAAELRSKAHEDPLGTNTGGAIGRGAAGLGTTGSDTAGRGTIAPMQLDVTKDDQVAAVAADVAANSDVSLLGIVNNAGIAVAGPLEFMPIEDLRRQFEVNVLGHVNVTQAFLPQLRRNGGRIVFIGSISGHVSSRLLGAYSASKFALEAIADAFRRELATWNLKVSIIEPGRVPTPIWGTSIKRAKELIAGLPPEATEYYQELIETVLDGAKDASESGAAPSEVAKAVHRALTERRPRTRYYVGGDAHIMNVLRRVLSDPLLDRLIRLNNR